MPHHANMKQTIKVVIIVFTDKVAENVKYSFRCNLYFIRILDVISTILNIIH